MVAPFATYGLARPLRVPSGLNVITVGGSTLGGSGKTRVALACAASLAERGVHVVLLGHAYRAAPGRVRQVSLDARAHDVGDEALACARFFARKNLSHHVRVVVGPSRQSALDGMADLGLRPDAVVIDGPLQLTPKRALLALLAVDAHAPWGSGRVFPTGDLRAPRDVLLAASDHLVEVDASPSAVTHDGRVLTLEELMHRRVGIFTAMGRPERLYRALSRSGLSPSYVIRVPNHGPVSERTKERVMRADADVDVWLMTEKCRTHFEAVPSSIHEPALVSAHKNKWAVLHEDIELPDAVERALEARFPSHPRTRNSVTT